MNVRLTALILCLCLASVAHASDGVRTDGVIVYGAVTLPCLGEPLSAELYAAELQRLYEQTVAMAESEIQFQQVRRAQACLTAVVPAADLARPSFLDGATAFSDGRLDDALAAFEEVFVVDPQHAWDDEYPPPAQHSFIDASASALRRPRATVRVMAPAGGEAWLDGVAMTGEDLEIVAGRHLVQVRPAEDLPIRSLLLEIEGASRVLVTVPAALAQPREAEPVGTEAHVVTFRGSRTAPVFLVVGAGLAAIGGVATALAARQLEEYNARITSGELTPFPSASAADPEQYQYYRVWQSHTRDVTVGCTLIGVGAGVMLLSIPIDVAHRRAQVGFTAAVPLGEDGPQGFSLGLVVQ